MASLYLNVDFGDDEQFNPIMSRAAAQSRSDEAIPADISVGHGQQIE